tara:strand:+ start:832 stop:2091 length:1260 start_codon:yes stop_codon:yes gene_type:complete
MLNKKKYNYSFNFGFNSKIKYPKNIQSLTEVCKSNYNIIGNCYSYNDASIGRNPISLKNFKKILNFDIKKKTIEAESGILLEELINFTLKKNLIIKSLPGSRYVTLGGIIANNTQGKTLKKCFIQDYIISLKVLHNRKIIECSLNKNRKLFFSTIGGKGCTGIIISAKLKLDKIYSSSIILEKVFFNNLEELNSKFKKLKKNDYLVAWIDNLSKNLDGIIFFATHSKNLPYKKQRSIIKIPQILIYLLNIISFRRFFTFFFNKIFKFENYLRKKITYHIFDFFFIQDTIKNWNEIFRDKGFFQYQFSCKFTELFSLVRKLQVVMNDNKIFSNFMIIKFYKKNKIIYNSVSYDICKNSNFNNTRKILNNFSDKHNLNISLSKDSIISNLNKKTIKSNDFLTYKIYDKNFNSKFLKRIINK